VEYCSILSVEADRRIAVAYRQTLKEFANMKETICFNFYHYFLIWKIYFLSNKVFFILTHRGLIITVDEFIDVILRELINTLKSSLF
jgi:hypothetical protein